MNLYRSRTTALLPLTRSGAANRRPDAEHPDEIKPHAMSGSLRLWGIGGLFGYIGYFKNRVLGNYKAYATHRRKTVVICTKDFEQIVISPDNPKEFVQAFEEARFQGAQSDSINREKIAAD